MTSAAATAAINAVRMRILSCGGCLCPYGLSHKPVSAGRPPTPTVHPKTIASGGRRLAGTLSEGWGGREHIAGSATAQPLRDPRRLAAPVDAAARCDRTS